MDPVEVIKTVRPGQSWIEGYSLEERRAISANWAAYRERFEDEEHDRIEKLNAAYLSLTLGQARELARFGIEHYDTLAEGDRLKGAQFLARLANFVSGALANEYPKILARDILWPDSMYRGADAPTRDKLLMRANADEEPERNGVLCALAWIGDKPVQAQFAAWRAAPPPWRSMLYIGPEEYAPQAGWELAPDGTQRELHFQTCYELLPVARDLAEERASPVRVLTPHEDSCQWCGEHLLTLFDLDLQDPRLAFVSGGGERLRIALCPWCSCYATVFTDVDLQGASRWSIRNDLDEFERKRISRTPDPEELFPTPEHGLILGRPRRTAYETQSSEVCLHESQIGGYPSWVQDEEYPICPGCKRRMPFIAQLATEDIIQPSEGITYAFACLDCGKATTVYQQT